MLAAKYEKLTFEIERWENRPRSKLRSRTVRSTSRIDEIDEIDEWMIAGLQREFSAAQNIAQKSVGTVLGTIWFKKLRNDPKSLQMNLARPGVYLGPIQRVRKSLEADKRCRLSILSLLRMPISPLRRGRGFNVTSCRSSSQQSLAFSDNMPGNGALPQFQSLPRITSLSEHLHVRDPHK